jgi:hypothetical protein
MGAEVSKNRRPADGATVKSESGTRPLGNNTISSIAPSIKMESINGAFPNSSGISIRSGSTKSPVAPRCGCGQVNETQLK